MRTRKPAALAATALLTAALVGIATPAHAAPTDCTTGRDGKTVWVYCAGGYGQYRVSIYVINPPTGSWPEYGPCVYPGQQRSEYTPYHNYSFLGPAVAYC